MVVIIDVSDCQAVRNRHTELLALLERRRMGALQVAQRQQRNWRGKRTFVGFSRSKVRNLKTDTERNKKIDEKRQKTNVFCQAKASSAA